MRVKIYKTRESMYSNDVIVSVKTNDGEQLLVVHKRSIQDDTINIGYPIDEIDNQYLIELPMETVTGSWRVWVDKEQIKD